MANQEEHVQKALDTLAELCDQKDSDEGYGRRNAAEEILRHYREVELTERLKDIVITLNVNGAIPVRQMTRMEIQQ
jgi:hypothetical protein